MKIRLYSLRDKHTGYSPFMIFENDEVAKRWMREMQKENITIRTTPEDFVLYYMGTFDKDTGEIEQIKPERVA